jgi:hypothetical protein
MSLHREAVSNELIELLGKLMQAPELDAFHLVGGTALALRFGHRKSIDLDLFTHTPFDASRLGKWIEGAFSLQEATTEKNTLLGQINGIKTDFIAHQYPLIGEVETIDGIRLFSVEDIAAMKLNAIANRGSKKDFWDYAELLKYFDREELLAFFARKYPNSSRWNVEKSLSYFDDAESDPDPIDLQGQTWNQVKAVLQTSNKIRN